VGNLGTAGVWRHQGFGGAHFAAVSNGVVRPDHFNYAPPPLQQRYDIGINGRPIGRSGVTFAPRGSSGVRLAAPRAEVHATPAPHAGGGGGGRR
jgi:hypothetical protein